jgi:ABC-2 type transport system permease protein
MTISTRRVRAIFRKELRDYRRNGHIVATMVVLPAIFLIQPLVIVLTLPPTVAGTIAHGPLLIYMLAIPALVPATISAYSVVGERQQGTLEPVLTTPIRREEFLLGKAMAALLPSLAVAYGVYAAFLVLVEIFAQPAIALALMRGSELAAQMVFTPLLATWSIWVGITISTRSSDLRVAQQLGILANLPAVLVTSLIAFNVISASLGLAAGAAGLLLVLGWLGWRIAAAAFDRERLIAGTR